MIGDEIPTDLVSFIDNVLWPTEAFARLCMESGEEVPSSTPPRGRLEDVGVVAGALASHSKRQLRDLANKLQAQIGGIEVSSPRDMMAVTTEVCQVVLKAAEK
jgi:hypothetical protein